MTCTNPLSCYLIKEEFRQFIGSFYRINPCSINCISFSTRWLDIFDNYVPIPFKFLESIQIPCRKCDACRLDYARQWSLKGMLEYQYFDEVGCFITLTYDNEHLPSYDLADCAKDFQDFMKRLRKEFQGKKAVLKDPLTGELHKPIRYLHCGEYGTLNGRPHHHAILFNFEFPDAKFRRMSKSGYPVYFSKSLMKLWSERIWTGEYEEVEKVYVTKYGTLKHRKYKRKVYKYIPKGKVEIGKVSYKSISYVARYVTKKVYGDDAANHYGDNKPEYITMSRRPGIGKYWFDQHYADMYTYDQFRLRGVNSKYNRFKPPKSFDKYFEKLYPDIFKQIKEYRKEMAIAFAKDPVEAHRENESRAFKLKQSLKALVRPLNDDIGYSYDERKLFENDSCFCI